MKNTSIYTWILLTMLCLGVMGCEKEENMVHTSISPVAYTAPLGEETIVLDPRSNAVVKFEWKPAVATNGTLVFYEVVFDEIDGDFSDPVYTGVPDKDGTESLLVLPHSILNRMAYDVGIPALAKGKLKWKVIATNGVDSPPSVEHATIEVLRPEGFAENPVNLYLTGTATEAGEDVTDAIQFEKVDDGIFELFTELSSGTFKMVDKTIGTAMSFYLDGTAIKEGDAAESPATSPTVYRIRLNFNNATANLTEIQSVGLWFSAHNQVTEELTYQGDGTWTATGVPIVFADVSWGKDERYKFLITEVDKDGQVTEEFWGSVNKDNNRPDVSTPASYYHLSDAGDDSQWDYTFKFAAEAPKNDIIVMFKAPEYTHQVIVKP